MKVTAIRISLIINMLGIFSVFFLIFAKLFNAFEIPIESLLVLILIVGSITAMNYILIFDKHDNEKE